MRGIPRLFPVGKQHHVTLIGQSGISLGCKHGLPTTLQVMRPIHPIITSTPHIEKNVQMPVPAYLSRLTVDINNILGTLQTKNWSFTRLKMMNMHAHCFSSFKPGMKYTKYNDAMGSEDTKIELLYTYHCHVTCSLISWQQGLLCMITSHTACRRGGGRREE